MVIAGSLLCHRLHELRQIIGWLPGCQVLKPSQGLLATQPKVADTLHRAFVDCRAFLDGHPERTFARGVGPS
jgi:hypothetical protein